MSDLARHNYPGDLADIQPEDVYCTEDCGRFADCDCTCCEHDTTQTLCSQCCDELGLCGASHCPACRGRAAA